MVSSARFGGGGKFTPPSSGFNNPPSGRLKNKQGVRLSMQLWGEGGWEINKVLNWKKYEIIKASEEYKINALVHRFIVFLGPSNLSISGRNIQQIVSSHHY